MVIERHKYILLYEVKMKKSIKVVLIVIPKKGDPVIEIPITFDSHSKVGGLTNDKFILALLIFGAWLFTVVVSILIDITIMNKILYILCSFIVVSLFVRYVVMREHYFKKKREDLLKNDYRFPYGTFWNIYEITSTYPYICRYVNGLKAIFVVFDKDVIVGRSRDNDYYHYEAISEAYLQMYKRGIDCMHIDYMDTVGKDERVKSLFTMAENTENENLQEILTRIFDNVEDIMQHSYASYDVYCFFYNGKDELFMDELEVVINSFLEANYIRYRILNKEEIGELVKSLYNIEKFSVNEASEKLFMESGSTRYLTPIWIERDNERKILNRTIEEKEAERQVRAAEKDLKHSKVKPRGVNKLIKKYKEEEEIDLFGDANDVVNSNNYMGSYGENQFSGSEIIDNDKIDETYQEYSDEVAYDSGSIKKKTDFDNEDIELF